MQNYLLWHCRNKAIADSYLRREWSCYLANTKGITPTAMWHWRPRIIQNFRLFIAMGALDFLLPVDNTFSQNPAQIRIIVKSWLPIFTLWAIPNAAMSFSSRIHSELFDLYLAHHTHIPKTWPPLYNESLCLAWQYCFRRSFFLLMNCCMRLAW